MLTPLEKKQTEQDEHAARLLEPAEAGHDDAEEAAAQKRAQEGANDASSEECDEPGGGSHSGLASERGLRRPGPPFGQQEQARRVGPVQAAGGAAAEAVVGVG